MNEREKYLNKIKKEKITVISLRISILFAFFILWELLSSLSIIDSFFFSSPSRIVKLFISMDKSELVKHVGITLSECIFSFSLSVLIGFTLAILLWWSELLRKILDPYIVILNSLPKIALGPLIIIWVGVGTASIVTMDILIMIVITIISMLNAFRQVEESKIMLLKSMNASKFQILYKLIFFFTFI